jgi:NADPH:quinone reductase
VKVLEKLGVDVALDYREHDFVDAVKEFTDGRGADVIYDPVGGKYTEPALRSIAWQGRFLVVGFAAGDIPKLPLNLVLLKGCDVLGVFWGAFIDRDPEGHRANTRQLIDWCAKEKISSHVHATYPLTDGIAALKSIAARQVMGKVILRP